MDQSISASPCLKVVGLPIEGLRALERVDWPADGMGWQERVPDVVMVGGVNGSGKTTLLQFITDAVRALVDWRHLPPPQRSTRAWLDLDLTSSSIGQATICILLGDKEFIKVNKKTDDCVAILQQADAYAFNEFGPTWNKTHQLLSRRRAFIESANPGKVSPMPRPPATRGGSPPTGRPLPV